MATNLNELQGVLDDLQQTIDDTREILEEAYTPEATRADLVAAVSQALDLLSGEEEDEDGEDEEEDEEE